MRFEVEHTPHIVNGAKITHSIIHGDSFSHVADICDGIYGKGNYNKQSIGRIECMIHCDDNLENKYVINEACLLCQGCDCDVVCKDYNLYYKSDSE